MAKAADAPLVIIKACRHGQDLLFPGRRAARRAGKEPADYRRILISRPNVHFDDDIGFLPGDESEKIAPLLRPSIDNLELPGRSE